MPVHHAIWRVGDNPQPLTIGKLASELLLEKMILNDPTILSDQWMIIGHQEAVDEIGFFGNLNSVCKPATPKWRHTIEKLKRSFINCNAEW